MSTSRKGPIAADGAPREQAGARGSLTRTGPSYARRRATENLRGWVRPDQPTGEGSVCGLGLVVKIAPERLILDCTAYTRGTVCLQGGGRIALWVDEPMGPWPMAIST